MSSPAKRRKLDGGDKKTSVPSRGLEYFFAKQRQGATSGNSQTASEDTTPNQTDEELARKLQAEFDKEALCSPPNASETPRQSSSTPPDKPDDKAGPSASDQADGVTLSPKPPPKSEATTLKLQSSGSAEDTVSSLIPLDESPLTFDPAEYIPKLHESWSSQGGNATYALLARCFMLVNSTQSRIKIVDTLVNCIRLLIEGDPESLLPAVRVPSPGSPTDLT